MVSISLCMIVRNEEKVLGRCLACVQGFADEIIIVDTGSTDRTKEIAFSFTDKVYDFKWKDDFAAARNFAFSRGTGDYLFWLDADDVIRQEEWRKLMDLKRRLDMERPDVVMIKIRGWISAGMAHRHFLSYRTPFKTVRKSRMERAHP